MKENADDRIRVNRKRKFRFSRCRNDQHG